MDETLMRKLLLLSLILLCVPSSSLAAYVNSAVGSTGTATSTTCSPNGGGVTAGDIEVMVAWQNVGSWSGISSTRVTTWTQDYNNSNLSYWHGVATSSGAETITVTLPSDSVGSVCGEWSTTTLNVTNANATTVVSVTTTKAVTDLVLGASSNGSTVTLSAPFTQRQNLTIGASTHLVLGDSQQTSTGTYTSTITATNPHQCLSAFYTPASANKVPPMMN
jgi:hypothetical protein